MQFLSVLPPTVYMNVPPSAATIDGQLHGFTARVLRYANQSWVTGLASFVTTAIILLPVEYETPIRSLMLFLSSRRV
jgi:hypothetical protein